MTPHPDFMRSGASPVPKSSVSQAPAPHTALLQKGLEAMQQLQAQTARAHEKFLDTQAQASRTLAELMAQTRGEVPVRYAVSQTENLTDPIQSVPVHPPVPEPVSSPVRPSATNTSPAPLPAPVAQEPNRNLEPVAVEPVADTGVQTILFNIVSRLTGFPVEMLEPQMDIESDLGIDSIKKVEIISELEKEMPQGEGLSSEHLTTVKTLEDICLALSGTTETGSQASPQAETDPAPEGGEPTESGQASRTMAVLVSVISDLTGFPQEMLEPRWIWNQIWASTPSNGWKFSPGWSRNYRI